MSVFHCLNNQLPVCRPMSASVEAKAEDSSIVLAFFSLPYITVIYIYVCVIRFEVGGGKYCNFGVFKSSSSG